VVVSAASRKSTSKCISITTRRSQRCPWTLCKAKRVSVQRRSQWNIWCHKGRPCKGCENYGTSRRKPDLHRQRYNQSIPSNSSSPYMVVQSTEPSDICPILGILKADSTGIMYQTHSTKWISGFQDFASNTGLLQSNKLFWINLWPWLLYLQKNFYWHIIKTPKKLCPLLHCGTETQQWKVPLPPVNVTCLPI
jgi:hypothetical protein